MTDKTMVMIGASLGSVIGGFIPSLWGADLLSWWSVILTTVGGLGGVYLVAKYVGIF